MTKETTKSNTSQNNQNPDNTKATNSTSVGTTVVNDENQIPKKQVKPPKLEDKPFDEFINNHLIPELSNALSKYNLPPREIRLIKGDRPVVGGECWMVIGEMHDGRRFWLCFNDQKITSTKTIALAEQGTEPSLLESFLIDEKKATLALLTSRLMQRLNGQKLLGAN